MFTQFLTYPILATAQGFGWERPLERLGSSFTSGPVVLGIGTIALGTVCLGWAFRHEIVELAHKVTGVAMAVAGGATALTMAAALFVANGAVL